MSEYKIIKDVKGSLITGDFLLSIEVGTTLASGDNVSKVIKTAFSFGDILETPVTQATPPLDNVPVDFNNPLAHFVNGTDDTQGIKQFQPITPQNQAEKLADRLAMLAELIGSDTRHYAQISSAWAVLIQEKNNAGV